jgi:hypothetical protein
VDAAPSDQNAQHPVTYAKDVSNAYAPPAKGGEVPSTTMVIHSGTADKEYHF